MSTMCECGRRDRRYILGLSASGTVSNMSVSMLAWMAQFAEVSLRAVTRTEYRCATVMEIKSMGDSATSVYQKTISTGLNM